MFIHRNDVVWAVRYFHLLQCDNLIITNQSRMYMTFNFTANAVSVEMILVNGADSPGRRLVIVHGYTKNQFFASTLLILKIKLENRNYHNEMNFEKF